MVFDWTMLCESIAYLLMGIGALFMSIYLSINYIKIEKGKIDISRERNEQLHLISDRLNEINVTLDNISKGVWYEK